MVSILNKVIGLFRKKNYKKNEEEFQKSYSRLEYTGEEPICMACNYPIHETQRKKKLDGKLMHERCFKKLKKMVFTGGSINGF